MKRIALIAALAGLLGIVAAVAQELSSEPRASLAWLRALVLEGRVALRLPNRPDLPRLFTETVADGRTWMDYISDTLGAAAGGDPAQPGVPDQWALLDEAVSLLLAEAKRMADLAATSSSAMDRARIQIPARPI